MQTRLTFAPELEVVATAVPAQALLQWEWWAPPPAQQPCAARPDALVQHGDRKQAGRKEDPALPRRLSLLPLPKPERMASATFLWAGAGAWGWPQRAEKIVQQTETLRIWKQSTASSSAAWNLAKSNLGTFRCRGYASFFTLSTVNDDMAASCWRSMHGEPYSIPESCRLRPR